MKNMTIYYSLLKNDIFTVNLFQDGTDHIHMYLSYPAKLSISEIVKRLKDRSSRMLMNEYPTLKKCYWGKHFWAIGYGAWSTGNITEEMVQVPIAIGT